MKKLAVLLGLVGILMLAVSMAQAQSDWAYYKEHPAMECSSCEEVCVIYDGYTGPQNAFILSYSETIGDCTIDYYTLDCCACHGPCAPGNHGGPKFPYCSCP